MVKYSPFIGASSDTSSDVSGAEVLFTTIKYIDQNCNIKELLLNLRYINSKSAINIYEELKSVFNDFDLFHRLASFSTDGEPSMSSLDNGVAGFIKKEIPFIFNF